MTRKTKYFLATTCFVAVGVIIYRFARLQNNLYLPSKTKIYSFSIGNDAVTIKQNGDNNQVKDVKWIEKVLSNLEAKDSGIKVSDSNIKESPISSDMSTGNNTSKVKTQLKYDSSIKIATTHQTRSETITIKPTTQKAIEKVVIMSPPFTEAATIDVVTPRPSDLPMCSFVGENLGKSNILSWWATHSFSHVL